MRAFLFLLLIAMSAAAHADYYYLWNEDPHEGTQYPTPDAACHAAYDWDQSVAFPAQDYTVPSPFVGPTPDPYNQPPKYVSYSCDQSATNPSTGETATFAESVRRMGNDCTSTQTYNPQTGECEQPDQEADRKELGDPRSPQVAGMVVCGDPVNPATGNVYEAETDYYDQDGELRYARHYNSQAGYWNFSYQTSLYVDPDPRAAPTNVRLVELEDGRSILFTLNNGIATPEASEQGTLTQVNGLWTYSSPANEQFTFDAKGRLTRWKQANGLIQTLAYTQVDYATTIITVTDSHGHTLQITTWYNNPKTVVVNGLTITYQLDNAWRLSKVTRTWSGHSTSRTYLYEDTAYTKMLTGVIDERGIRSASWTYDAQGRAIANQQAGGANKVTFAYGPDGATTVTNALGQATIYRFAIVQGVKRITTIEGEPVLGCPASNSRYTYTSDGLMATKTDARGYITAYTYDTHGRQIKEVEAQGTADQRTTTTTWDGTGFRPATVTTADRMTTYTYDDQGRTLSTTVHSLKD